MQASFPIALRCLQISYIALLSIGYYLYWYNIFALLPNAWASDLHM
jgi:hypothetical protein